MNTKDINLNHCDPSIPYWQRHPNVLDLPRRYQAVNNPDPDVRQSLVEYSIGECMLLAASQPYKNSGLYEVFKTDRVNFVVSQLVQKFMTQPQPGLSYFFPANTGDDLTESIKDELQYSLIELADKGAIALHIEEQSSPLPPGQLVERSRVTNDQHFELVITELGSWVTYHSSSHPSEPLPELQGAGASGHAPTTVAAA